MLTFEIDIVPGIEEQAVLELRGRRFGAARLVGPPGDGRLVVSSTAGPTSLNRLRTATAVNLVEHFAVPRPLALLGHEHLTRLVASIRGILAEFPPDAFRTIRLSAAGADSPAFSRLRATLATTLRLEPTTDPAHLQIAVRRPESGESGWDVAIRTSANPLATRAWRVCNLPGALNATVASAMARLADPKGTDRYLNLGCGSGTLLIERLELVSAAVAIGVDTDTNALDCAKQNVAAWGRPEQVMLLRGDARRLPIDGASIDTLTADLPFGHLVESDQNIDGLYLNLLKEATRVVVSGGRFVAITTRAKSFERAVEPVQDDWVVERILTLRVPFRSGYIQPRIHLLRRV